jgi:peroxisomal 3,2-trans-enoyl-CoA isomerase
MSKRITCQELLATGFVNGVFDVGDAKTEGFSNRFLERVMQEVGEKLGEHLNSESLVRIKALIQGPGRAELDRQGVEEVMGGLKRFVSEVPQEEFRRLAAGEKRHKL